MTVTILKVSNKIVECEININNQLLIQIREREVRTGELSENRLQMQKVSQKDHITRAEVLHVQDHEVRKAILKLFPRNASNAHGITLTNYAQNILGQAVEGGIRDEYIGDGTVQSRLGKRLRLLRGTKLRYRHDDKRETDLGLATTQRPGLP